MTTGFVALWKNTDQEFRASPAEEHGTTAAIQAAFARGRARGTLTYGLFSCRFSSSWQYFTFWIAPSMAAVFDTIADLERAGDFKFASSRHVCGQLALGEPDPNPNWSVIPQAFDVTTSTLGIITFTRQRPSASRASAKPYIPPGTSSTASGLRTYGVFDCRFSSGWDRFSFATAPDLSALDHHVNSDSAPGVETERFVGTLESFYRFGSHLQRDLTWLDGEPPQ